MAPASGPAGCVVCRSRKVRCDRLRPSCQNCERLGVRCPGYHDENDPISRTQLHKLAEEVYASSGVERRRFGTCEACKVAKERCTRTRPACRRCSFRGLECIYQTSSHGTRRPRRESVVAGVASCRSMSFEEPLADMGEKTPQRSTTGLTQKSPSSDLNIENPLSDRLSDDLDLRYRLVRIFFERIHPLRCSSFIHKPSFLFSIDHGTVLDDYGEPLLYAMCASAARVLQSDCMRAGGPTYESAADSHLPAGHAWAETARKSIMHGIHEPTQQHIMTLLLLCDYALETDQNALAYVLIGCAFRAIRLLGLDIPCQPQASIEYETGIRLVWASYTADALLASGVALNSSWQNNVPRVPLPCSHRGFLARSPEPTCYLHTLRDTEGLALTKKLDLPALTIVLIRIRSEVLQMIRVTPASGTIIWDATSPFMKMLNRLDTFHANLPERFTLTNLNIYIHKDENTLGAVFALHFFYHAAVFDLTRISLPGFAFPLAAAFLDAPQSFRSQCQERCRFHANAVSDMVAKGFQQAPIAFDDPVAAQVVAEATKIQIIHSATVAGDESSVTLTMDNVRTNLRLLRYMQMHKRDENQYIRLLRPLCVLFGFREIAEEMSQSTTITTADAQAEVTGSADMHHLVAWAPFRKAMRETQSKQASPTSSASLASSDPQPHPPIMSMSSTGVLQQPLEASIDDYTRAAEEMGDYITWDMSELVPSDMPPPWVNFDWMNTGPGPQ